jgi:hypothetical protein
VPVKSCIHGGPKSSKRQVAGLVVKMVADMLVAEMSTYV